MEIINDKSPFAIQNPASLNGLKLRHRFGQKLQPKALVSVIEANPEIIPDEQNRALILAILRGETGPGRGRPKMSHGRKAMLVLARMYIEDRTAEIRAERAARKPGAKRVRGEKEPGLVAAEEICFQFDCTGPNLINQISALKKDPYLGE